MLHFFKFRQDLYGPVPASEIYIKRGPGRGWPEECPPIRAANAFGFDVLANFDVTFTKKRDGTWRVEPDTVIESDFDWSPPGDDAGNDNHDAGEVSGGHPLVQQYAWPWDKGQSVPHKISDNVFDLIKNQIKLSSFLFLKTDPNELLYMTDVPNMHGSGSQRPWRATTALVDTDWYPASYPWHAVIELSPREKSITIKKGEPVCRIMPVRRDTYFAQAMSPDEFDRLFQRSQRWLGTHGKPTDDPATLDITRTYARQQLKSRFVVTD